MVLWWIWRCTQFWKNESRIHHLKDICRTIKNQPGIYANTQLHCYLKSFIGAACTIPKPVCSCIGISSFVYSETESIIICSCSRDFGSFALIIDCFPIARSNGKIAMSNRFPTGQSLLWSNRFHKSHVCWQCLFPSRLILRWIPVRPFQTVLLVG